MTAALVALGLMAAVGFGYLYLAAKLKWGQLPEVKGWDGVERRTVRSLPRIAGVSDRQLAEFQASLAAEYALIATR